VGGKEGTERRFGSTGKKEGFRKEIQRGLIALAGNTSPLRGGRE